MENITMPFGKHKGKNVEDVPDSYLLWLLEEGNTFGDIAEYLKKNEDAIRKNAEKAQIIGTKFHNDMLDARLEGWDNGEFYKR